ncbi:hypothetical protein [Enterococcus pallens]|uniref:Uncharacterized protein n=1 Tax=Enterococcus pallens ATCC BAA-351 TaxID=1158607 RepID=R2QEL6_9ENTE|nr:hypothetical protein [Enterococcus pallens]EOH93693.1 hypothetical protein UAU_02389 [Enterococcus pallens ATCC BAA-351]EOU24533.1 hypothetical protein I588_00520 [Enterococcus pallens ATCC BAA-351]OJG78579.1 hypothetical protein RV10_GL001361 [Enterococcus pallens]
MEQDFDFVTLFKILNEYKSGGNNQRFLVAFTGIIFKKVKSDSRQFKKDWKTEIENGGSISEDFAKTILRRTDKLPAKYGNELATSDFTAINIKAEMTDEVFCYLNLEKNADDLEQRLKQEIEKSSNPELVKRKEKLLSYTDFEDFLCELIIFSVKELSQNTHTAKKKRKSVKNRKATKNEKVTIEKNNEQPIYSDQKIVFLPDQELDKYEKKPDEHYLEKFKPELKTGLLIENTVRKDTDKHWSKTIEADENELIHFQIKVENKGDVKINDILVGELKVNNLVVRDILPDNLIYVKGSTVLYNTTNPNGISVNDDLISNTGMNIGGYQSGGNAYIRFSAKVGQAKDFPCNGLNKFTNIAQISNQVNSLYDNAHIITNKPFDFND